MVRRRELIDDGEPVCVFTHTFQQPHEPRHIKSLLMPHLEQEHVLQASDGLHRRVRRTGFGQHVCNQDQGGARPRPIRTTIGAQELQVGPQLGCTDGRVCPGRGTEERVWNVQQVDGGTRLVLRSPGRSALDDELVVGSRHGALALTRRASRG